MVWSDGNINIIYRTCSDFFFLQVKTLKMKQLPIGTFLRVPIGAVSLSHTLTSLYCKAESLRILQHTTSLQSKNKYSTFVDCGLLFAKTDQYYSGACFHPTHSISSSVFELNISLSQVPNFAVSSLVAITRKSNLLCHDRVVACPLSVN